MYKASPIKCLDSDDTSSQVKLEGWLYIVYIVSPFLMWRHHFIGNFGKEAPFYWLFQRGGTVFWVNLGRGRLSFFIYAQNYAGGWLEFNFMVHALPGGLVM